MWVLLHQLLTHFSLNAVDAPIVIYDSLSPHEFNLTTLIILNCWTLWNRVVFWLCDFWRELHIFLIQLLDFPFKILNLTLLSFSLLSESWCYILLELGYVGCLSFNNFVLAFDCLLCFLQSGHTLFKLFLKIFNSFLERLCVFVWNRVICLLLQLLELLLTLSNVIILLFCESLYHLFLLSYDFSELIRFFLKQIAHLSADCCHLHIVIHLLAMGVRLSIELSHLLRIAHVVCHQLQITESGGGNLGRRG